VFSPISYSNISAGTTKYREVLAEFKNFYTYFTIVRQ
jgi:hypothetical protein